MPSYDLYGFFNDKTTGVGKENLTVTFDLRSNAGVLLVNNLAATQIGGGAYWYQYVSANKLSAVGVFKTSSTDVTSPHVPALVVEQVSYNLDTTVGSRVSATDLTPTRAANLDKLDIAVSTVPSLISVPTVDQIDTKLSTVHGAGSWVSTGSGSGDIKYSYPVIDTATTLPIEGVLVKCTTDIDGLNLAGSAVTNSFGIALFDLNAGTYYFWCYAADYTFANFPDVEVVS